MFHAGFILPPELGYINFIEQSESTKVPFMFNPAEVPTRHGWSHGEQPVPGRSHPHYSGGAGKAETFSIQLQLDADRGFLQRRRRNYPTGASVEAFLQRAASPQSVPTSLFEDLRPLIDKFHQFSLPGELPGHPQGSYGVPRRIMMNIGSVFPDAEIGIDDIEMTVIKAGPRNNILKATIGLNGHIVERTNVTNRMLVQRSQRLDRDLPDVVLQERTVGLPNVTD